MMEDDPLAFLRGEAQPAAAEISKAALGFSIFIMLETGDSSEGEVRSKEITGKAIELSGQLGGSVTGCILGTDALEQAKRFQHFGLNRLFACPCDNLRMAIDKLAVWAKSENPWLWLFCDSDHGRLLATQLAARLSTGLVVGALQLDLNLTDEVVEFTHLEFEGKMKRTLAMKSIRPQMATLAKGSAFPAAENTSQITEIESLEI